MVMSVVMSGRLALNEMFALSSMASAPLPSSQALPSGALSSLALVTAWAKRAAAIDIDGLREDAEGGQQQQNEDN